MLLNEQSSDRWLETCGVIVITKSFRYYKWLRLQWESVDVSLVQVMACRLFGAKPLPEPVEGLVIWNVMTAMLRHCNNSATKRDFGITNDYISNERVWRCALLLARQFYWTNSRATGDWKHQNAMSWQQAVNHYPNMGCIQLIDVETTWLPRCRQHFYMQFVRWIYWYLDSNFICHK